MWPSIGIILERNSSLPDLWQSGCMLKIKVKEQRKETAVKRMVVKPRARLEIEQPSNIASSLPYTDTVAWNSPKRQTLLFLTNLL
jgi:hypothetical protein